jgi:hypothetical protein
VPQKEKGAILGMLHVPSVHTMQRVDPATDQLPGMQREQFASEVRPTEML